MKKKILILVMSLCMVAAIAPISLFAVENSNKEEIATSESIEGMDSEQGANEGSIALDNDSLEESDAKESLTKVEQEETSEVVKEEINNLTPTRNNVQSNASPRGVNSKIKSKLPSSDDILRYVVLTEDSAKQTGTVMLGWTDSTGPNGSTYSGNATEKLLINKDLVLPGKIKVGVVTYTLTKIGEQSLKGLGIETIEIPTTVTEIEDSSIRDNLIKELKIPEGVTTIGSDAFTSNTLEVVRFPSTITHLSSNVLRDFSYIENLRNVYFPVSNDFTFTDTTSTNKPFGFSPEKVAVICETKEQFEKWNKNNELFSDVNDQTITYEMTMEFYDRDGKSLDFEKPVKKLYGKPISWVQNSEGTWKNEYISTTNWGKINDLPAIPSDLDYEAKYWGLDALGVVTVNKDGQIEVSNTQGGSTNASNWMMRALTNKMYAVEEKLEITLNETPEKTYDGIADLGVSLNRNSKVLSKFLNENKTQYRLIFWVFEKEDNSHYSSYPIRDNIVKTDLKNVVDSGDYGIAVSLMDKRISSLAYAWSTPMSGNFGMNETIKIKPAKINVDFDVDDIIWNNQTSLPEITLNWEEHGAEGKIVWDADQSPQKGTKSYSFTFTPSDASGIKDTDQTKQAANYESSSISGSVEITYKEIKYFDVLFTGINGNVIQKQTIEEGKSAIAPEAPNVAGYKFIGWDKSFNNVRSDLVIKAIYEKLPAEKPSGGGTPVFPPVNRPITPPVNTSSNEPVIAEKKEEVKNDNKNVVENKKEGVKVETSNKDKVFKSDAEVVVIDASKQEKKKAQQKLDDIIKVLEVVIKEDGIKVERTLDSKFKIFLDAKDYKNIKNLKVWQKTKDGDYKSLSYEIKDGQIIFECDALDTYVLTGKKKVAVKENDSFPWWIIVLIVAGAGTAFYVYKKSNKESE